MKTAFIFDLDGVIVDTARLHFQAWQRLAQELGFSFTLKDNERLKGVSRMEALKTLLEIGETQADDQQLTRMADRKNSWYVEALEHLSDQDVLPGAETFLKNSRDLGIKIALGSASQNARTILEKLKLIVHFDVIVDGTMTTKAKPNPEVFSLGAKLLGAAPDDCIVFEDSHAGIEAARAAGMKTVGIGKPDVLQKAHLVVPSLAYLSPHQVMKDFNCN